MTLSNLSMGVKHNDAVIGNLNKQGQHENIFTQPC